MTGLKFFNIWIIFMSLLLHIQAHGTHTIQSQIDFCQENYSVNQDNGQISIDTNNELDILGAEGPYLPMRQINIAIPSDMEVSQISVTPATATLLSSGYQLAQIPRPVATNVISSSEKHPLNAYCENISPIQIKEAGKTIYQECTILHYLVYPFTYDNSTSSLYFHSYINLDILLEEKPNTTDNLISVTGFTAELLKQLVINPEYIDDLTSSIHPLILNEEYIVVDGNQASPLDYIIITNESLKTSFEDLLNWKITKGLRSRIITTESIAKQYTGKTLQEKIKKCIYSLYEENGISYVLLGGDDAIVPSVKCFGVCSNDTAMIPSDLYYGCFANQFDWDKNENGILGETDDDCSFIPSVIVTRLPVSNVSNVKTVTNKILGYEKDPILIMRMLMAGNELDHFSSGYADTYLWSIDTYQNYISKYWYGTVEYFFDSSTKRQVTPEAIVSKFNSGYPFISMHSHGGPTEWCCRTGEYFSISHINQIKRGQVPGTIITTTACDTNAFDLYTDPESDNYGKMCLSQSFINSPTSGVIGYFGSSRSGWYRKSSQEGDYSFEFDKMFYNTLFSNPDENKSFGRIATIAKLLNIAGTAYNFPYRWLQFSLNPIGDPEMPIYVESPKDLTSVFVKEVYYGIKPSYTIDTGEDGCNICITGILNGNNVQAIFRNVRKIQLSKLPMDPVICVTKQNFRPFIGTGTSYFWPSTQNEAPFNSQIESCILDTYSNILNVSIGKMDENSDSNIIISDVMGSMTRHYPINQSNSIEIDLGNFNKGVYIVTLCVDGSTTDCRRIIKR